MPDLYLVVDLIVVLSLVGLGATVLVKNNAVALNRIFAWFVGCIGVWIMANYVSNDTHYLPIVAVRASYFVFFFSYVASILFLQFGVRLANDAQAARLLRKAYVPLYVIGLSGATPLVVKGVSLQGSVYAVQFGPLTALYFTTLVLNLAAAAYVVQRNIVHATGDQRGRLVVLLRTLYWTLPLLVLAQVIVPATLGWFGLTNLGILPMLIMVFGLYYGVVKHRLFDLRPIILRAVVYLTTVSVIAVIYSLLTHYITTVVAKYTAAATADFLNIVLIVVAVSTYSPLKQLFRKLTNRFFYQDAYDPQELLNHLNRALVSTLEIDKLMDRTIAIISQYMKVEFCVVGIQDDGKGFRMFGASGSKVTAQDVQEIRHITGGLKQKVVITDYLGEASTVRLQAGLQKHNIAALVNLTPSNLRRKESVGCIVLGGKRSGSPYTSQDTRVLDTIANELIIAIQNALRFEEIERFNATLQEKVDEATRRLRRTNEKLRQMDETKDDFISMASHQLRTPLTSVKGYVSMVLDGDAGRVLPLQRKLLNQAFISSQRMVYLISDLLNVSRLRTGKFVIEPVPTNLITIIRDEVDQLIETAKGRNLALGFHHPEHMPSYLLDETKLRQVIMNFIDNAIYYTPSGGHITVTLEDKPKSIELTVTDDGIGVPRAEQPHLFSKFYRAHNAKRARPDGTGLGLFMAKKVVIAQGGAIIFHSELNKGSTFGFSFAKEHLAEAGGAKKPPAATAPAVRTAA